MKKFVFALTFLALAALAFLPNALSKPNGTGRFRAACESHGNGTCIHVGPVRGSWKEAFNDAYDHNIASNGRCNAGVIDPGMDCW